MSHRDNEIETESLAANFAAEGNDRRRAIKWKRNQKAIFSSIKSDR